MINFSGTDTHQDVTDSIHKNFLSIEAEYDSLEDPLSKLRTTIIQKIFETNSSFHVK